ncbi:aminoacyl-tRNA hydrolase [Helicobacter turcicus]|uniref:Peptidyl-tRNA hydrolase n=1 Tax=Helicobacter turcicus TaxID=2867412 RepID=A0ABS7JL48_9HELI|nr:aminoacyl-tRNA hydrolase [Helicobacter turcicus]MBX7490127.1 aminoacyl-tRNA hydrolase [Helicobacter turcicus]MBX7544986.1 aminoacyl-tRNA hydrolase [Helicobacter turcicus]
MFLIVGLGNPGQKYQNNRHNIGFRVIDSLIQTLNTAKQSAKDFQGELHKSSQLLLLKPKTFMNLSGKSVQSVLNFYKITDFLVIHDELDLPFGAVKFKFGGGNGGHNGLKSIDSLCGNHYYRIRYGIGKPAIKSQTINWVLQDFSALEEEQNQALIAHSANAALEIAKLDSSDGLATKISNKWTLSPKLNKDTYSTSTQSKNLFKVT